MIRIANTVPVRTRLPLAAWVGAGIATLLSMVSSLVQFSSSGVVTAMAEHAHYASVTELLGFLRAL
jgi:ABC-type enterochelin transport system ATPase subunit